MNDPDELLTPEITVTVSDVKAPLRLHRLQGREGLGMLFEYRLDLVNWDESDVGRKQLSVEGLLAPETLLGKILTVTLPLDGGKSRTITGLVTQAAFRESIDHHTAYAVTIRPELWLLTLSENCRVFQDKTVPDVLKEILKAHGLGAPREGQSRKYRTWDTLTQYRESDFAFISRLLAREGLYYFFEHGPRGHTMVLADSLSAHREHPDFATVPLGKPKPIAGSDEHLRAWQADFCLQSEAVTLADFDFRLRRPSARIWGQRAAGEGDVPVPASHRPPREIYDFPARAVLSENREEAAGPANPGDSRSEAAELARIRREAKRALAARYQGSGTVRWLAPGLLFCVEGCAQQFLASETEITLRNPAFRTSDTVIEEPCEITLKALDSTTPFRLLPVEKPRVLGPQTAWVVGEQDEEIWTDKHGRVRVHFHWDRERASEQGSSCWVRVAQPWAGNHWGTFSIPRVGSEVVVEFLYGDPDRPLVTGSVYSGENLPPYDLPLHKTRSGIKTRSSKGATAVNYNEIHFEDKKGHEELHLQAERNLTALVKHDQTVHVHGKREVEVKNEDILRVVESNRSVSVKSGHFKLHVCTDFDPGDLPAGTAMISALEEIRLVCGKASLSLRKDGTIEMKGTVLNLSGSDRIEANGKDAILALSQTITAWGREVTIDGTENVHLDGKGATIDLNGAVKAEGSQVAIDGKQEAHLKGAKSTLDLDDKEVWIQSNAIKLN